MADYSKAFRKTAIHEGGYVHDPDDAGGETYKGISRRFHPSWAGWNIIDQLKAAAENNAVEFQNELEKSKKLQARVKSFYKQFYWDRMWGNEIPVQEIAGELFDTGVNLGIRRAVRFLQEGLNLLNRHEENYVDILEDGIFGRKTLEALQDYLYNDDPSYLLKIMNILQGMHYIEIMRKNPSQEKYARGWLKRVKISS